MAIPPASHGVREMLVVRERRPAYRTIEGWAARSVLLEAGAIRECEEHGCTGPVAGFPSEDHRRPTLGQAGEIRIEVKLSVPRIRMSWSAATQL